MVKYWGSSVKFRINVSVEWFELLELKGQFIKLQKKLLSHNCSCSVGRLYGKILLSKFFKIGCVTTHSIRNFMLILCWIALGLVTSNFSKGGSKSSKMSFTMVEIRRKFLVTERLKRQNSDPFHLDFTYSNLSFLAAELLSLPLPNCSLRHEQDGITLCSG